jgi:hypothetical protein
VGEFDLSEWQTAVALEVLVKAPFPVVKEVRVAGSSVGFVVVEAFVVDFEREVPSQRLPEVSRVSRRYLIYPTPLPSVPGSDDTRAPRA